jgi:hypothetical protein
MNSSIQSHLIFLFSSGDLSRVIALRIALNLS